MVRRNRGKSLVEALKNRGMFHAPALGMNHRVITTSIVTTLSVTLLYYAVAWAVLRCPHQDDHSVSWPSYTIASYNAEVSLPISDEANFNCIGQGYHTEQLAGSAPGSELLRLTHDLPPGGSTWLTLLDIGRDHAGYISWEAVFNKGSPSVFLIDLPRYLSLSVFRF